MRIDANELASRFGLKVIGDTEKYITGISYVSEAVSGDLVFAGDRRYFEQAVKSDCSFILTDSVYRENYGQKIILLSSGNASNVFWNILSMQEQIVHMPMDMRHDSSVYIDNSAVVGVDCIICKNSYIGPNTKIGNNSVIYPNCYIGSDVTIGDNCLLYPNVNIYDRSVLENRVILHSGVVIGADGFGYHTGFGSVVKYPHLGTVRLCDDVEIGANSTVDRAKLGETYIGEGTKIDNLVQIGHNVKVGRYCIICAQSGVAGSTILDDFCVLGAQVGVTDHISLGKNVMVSAKSGVTKSCEAGAVLSGYPALSASKDRRVVAIKNRLPEIYNRVKAIEELLNIKK